MTNDYLNTALKNALGICAFEDGGFERRGSDSAHWCAKCGKAAGAHEERDYAGDLNAIHDAKMACLNTPEIRGEFNRQLEALCGPAWIAFATAKLHATALLRTLDGSAVPLKVFA